MLQSIVESIQPQQSEKFSINSLRTSQINKFTEITTHINMAITKEALNQHKNSPKSQNTETWKSQKKIKSLKLYIRNSPKHTMQMKKSNNKPNTENKYPIFGTQFTNKIIPIDENKR